MLIGICGLIGSGKDTVAQNLIDNHNFVKISFADKLKDAVASMFSWDRELLDGKTDKSWVPKIKPGNFKGGPRPDRTDPGSDPDRRQQLLGGSSRCHRADRPSFAGPVGASQKNPAGRHPVHRSRQSRPQHAPTFDPTSGGKNRHHRFHFGFYHVQMFSDVYCLADYRCGVDIRVAVDWVQRSASQGPDHRVCHLPEDTHHLGHEASN